MTRSELLELPPTVDLMTAAEPLGISRTLAYQLARAGEFPVKVLRLGARYRVVTSDLLAVLGVSPATADTAPASLHPAPVLRL